MIATRFRRPVEVPADHGDGTATVRTGGARLPNHITGSGQPEYVLDDPKDRARVYELVMTDANEDDVRAYIGLDVLLAIWDTMWLAPMSASRGPATCARVA